MKLNNLHDLYVSELKDLYNAENQIIKALPKMAKAAATDDLRQALEEHLWQTRGHVERLDQIFRKMEASPKGTKCKGMAGIIAEGEEAMANEAEPFVSDAALIAAAQRVEHYEIAAYGTVRSYARQLGYEEAAEMLQETLNEEGEADKRLTSIAESRVNAEAVRRD
jgi:ferritin-like metal-binding protein YciE